MIGTVFLGFLDILIWRISNGLLDVSAALEDRQARIQHLQSNVMEECMEYGVVMEPEYMVVSDEKEYQLVQGLCTDPTADSSDDDFQEAPLPDSVLTQLAFG